MVFSIFCTLVDKSIKKRKREFEKQGNMVLEQKQIEYLFKKRNFHKTLCKFNSAIVSHEKIKGVRYYTKYPFYFPFNEHDDFKKFSIAYGIGEKIDMIYEKDIPLICSILDKLSSFESFYHPTKLIAWNSLGKVAQKYPEIFEIEEKRIKQSMKSHSLSNTLGGILFFNELTKTSEKISKIEEIIKDSFKKSKNDYSKILMIYYVNKNLNKNLMENEDIDGKIKEFFESYLFNEENLAEGLKKIGIINKKKLPLWKNTPHEKVINQTIDVCKEFLPIVGAFSIKND